MNAFLKKVIAVTTVLSIFCSFTIAHAVGSQFNVNLTVGADITAPSIPTGLTATAVSTSQIDLTWTASTDNVAVTGYKIYRDSTYIATAIGTTYSDVGLTASTLYTYTVSAIDGSSNESSQSSSASATTFSASTTTSTGGTQSGAQQPVIYDVVVAPTKFGALVRFKTNVPTTGTLSWGETVAYEIGASTETIASLEHTISISGLLPATGYVFQIDAVNGYGAHAFLSNQSFTTLSLEAGATNASNFTAKAQTSSILLNWNNPAISDFANVRIVRSDSFYPADANDGVIVYEGNAESYTDADVLVGTRYYYTLFVKYADGTYSSGILADARIPKAGEVETPIDVIDTLPQAPSVHPLINALSFIDFDFIQNGKKITSNDGKSVMIDGESNLTVSLRYEKVPEVLKTIAITLADPEDPTQTFSFLLRVNSTKTAYVATIAPLGKSGRYQVRIAIVDYKNRGLKKIVGSFLATAAVGAEKNRNYFVKLFLFVRGNFLDILLLLILILLILRSLKKMVDRNKKKPVLVCDIEDDSSSHDSNFK